MPILYDRKNAAKELSISPRKLDYLIQDGRIPVRRIDGCVRISQKVLLAFAERDQSPVSKAA